MVSFVVPLVGDVDGRATSFVLSGMDGMGCDARLGVFFLSLCCLAVLRGTPAQQSLVEPSLGVVDGWQLMLKRLLRFGANGWPNAWRAGLCCNA